MPQHYLKVDQQFLKASFVTVYLWIEPYRSHYQQETLWVLEDGRFYCAECVLIREELETALDSGKLIVAVPIKEGLFIAEHRMSASSNPHFDKEDWLQYLFQIQQRLQQPPTPASNCYTYFKEYLIEASDANLQQLQQEFKKLPTDGQLLFEFSEKDALYQLIQSGKHLDREERQYILNDYFEDKWVVLK